MPRITKVCYGRVRNLGHYETARCEVEVEVDHTEPDAEQVALLRAKAFVYRSLRLPLDEELAEVPL